MRPESFSRQPRFLPEMPSGEIKIESPPSKPQKPEISWLAILLPPAVMILASVFMSMSSSGAGYMLMMLAMTGVTLLTSIVAATNQIKKHRREKRHRERKYLQYITDLRADLAVKSNMQMVALTEMNPDVPNCFNRILSFDSKLWERTPAHSDFLSLRVGMGNVPFDKTGF